MNVFKIVSLLFLMLPFIGFIPERKPSQEENYVGMFTKEPITVDGILNEKVWKYADQILLKDNETGASVTDTSIQTRVKACYDKKNLYVVFICNDPDMFASFTQRDEYLWKDEVVEVFIDTDKDPDTYVEIEVSPSGVLFDSFIVNPEKIDFAETAKFNLKQIKLAVTRTGTVNKREDVDRGWVVEMAIPLNELVAEEQAEELAGKTWKINFFRVNRDAGKPVGLYAWSPTLGRFHTPSRFGTFLFK